MPLTAQERRATQNRGDAEDIKDRLPTQVDAANDALRVNVVAGGAAGNSVSQADKSAFAEGVGSGTAALGVFNDAPGADPAEDSAVALRATAKRALHTNLRKADGAELGVAGAPVRIDPTGTTTQPVSGTVTVSNQPAQPLTNTQLRAAAVPVDVTNKDLRVLGRAKLLDSAGAVTNPAKEDGNLAGIKAKTDNLDILLSALRDALIDPALKAGATRVRASIRVVTSTTDIYTVTAGKTFYLTDIIILVRNRDPAASGEFNIAEGATEKIPGQVATAATGSVFPQVYISEHFRTPIPFAAGTVVKYQELAGDLVASVLIVGYEL